MYEHFDTPRAPLQFAPEPSWPGLTPYERALDDIETYLTAKGYSLC